MRKIIVVGTGGLAREFTSFFYEDTKCLEIIGYSSTNHTEHELFNLPGKFFNEEINPKYVGTTEVVIAIGNPFIRKRISMELKNKGFTFPSFIHPTSTVSKRSTLSEGVIISPNCVISPNVVINSFSYLNFGCGLGHETTIGSFVQINPGTQVGGNAYIGDECLIGSGSTILQGVQIGKKTTIASGSVLFAKVGTESTMLGNPAKRFRAFEK